MERSLLSRRCADFDENWSSSSKSSSKHTESRCCPFPGTCVVMDIAGCFTFSIDEAEDVGCDKTSLDDCRLCCEESIVLVGDDVNWENQLRIQDRRLLL